MRQGLLVDQVSFEMLEGGRVLDAAARVPKERSENK